MGVWDCTIDRIIVQRRRSQSALFLRDRSLRDLLDLGAMRRLCNRTPRARSNSLWIVATGLCLLLFRPCHRHHQVAANPVESPVGQFAFEGSSLKWVTARPREGHAAACLRHGLDPTAPVVLLSDQARENTGGKRVDEASRSNSNESTIRAAAVDSGSCSKSNTRMR